MVCTEDGRKSSCSWQLTPEQGTEQPENLGCCRQPTAPQGEAQDKVPGCEVRSWYPEMVRACYSIPVSSIFVTSQSKSRACEALHSGGGTWGSGSRQGDLAVAPGCSLGLELYDCGGASLPGAVSWVQGVLRVHGTSGIHWSCSMHLPLEEVVEEAVLRNMTGNENQGHGYTPAFSPLTNPVLN